MSDALAAVINPLPALSAGARSSRLLRIYAMLAGALIAYPWLLAGFHAEGRRAVSGGPEAVFTWVGVALFLAAVFAVPAFAYLVAIRNSMAVSPEEVAARRAALLSVGAPPLFTLTGVTLAIFNVPGLETPLWTLAWIAVFGTLAFLHRRGAPTPVIASSLPALRVAHGISAALIILGFLALHLTNHLMGLWSADAHKAVMHALRLWYRSPWVQPVLVLAILFQVGSGLVLLRRRTISRADAFGTLQGMAGAYLAAFLASHLMAVFILGRWQGGIDTNWDWAVGNPAGLFADAWNVRLIPHYLIAVAAVVAHAGCGLRIVLLAHGVRERAASALALTIILAGILLAVAIMAGMLGFHLGH